MNVTRMEMLRVVHWAGVECTKQRSGELSVAWMVEGWDYAMTRNGSLPSTDDIRMLGKIVEPRAAAGGWRRCNVRVGNSIKGDWVDVPRQMMNLVGALHDPDMHIDSDEWFRQYEEIHPFADGNGRTGSILWNWINGTLSAPLPPPDFWKED